MRTIALVFSLLFVGTMSIQANTIAPFPGKFKVKAVVEGETTLVLTMINLQEETTIVSLKELNSIEPLYKEFIKDHNGYRMALHLKDLPQGRYVLTVKKGDIEQSQVVKVLYNRVLLSQFSK